MTDFKKLTKKFILYRDQYCNTRQYSVYLKIVNENSTQIAKKIYPN